MPVLHVFFLASLPYFMKHYELILTQMVISTRIFTFMISFLPAPKNGGDKCVAVFSFFESGEIRKQMLYFFFESFQLC